MLLSCLVTCVTIIYNVILHLSSKFKEKKSKPIDKIKGKIK